MGKKSIYYTTYFQLFIIAVAFFAHNSFESINDVDLFHLNQIVTFHVFGGEYSIFIKDVYPFIDFPEKDIYGNPLRLNLQVYLHKVGQKVIVFSFAFLSLRVWKAFNAMSFLIAKDVPYRSDSMIVGFLYVFVALSAYDLFDYTMLYSQTPFVFEVTAFSLGIIYVYFDRR